MPTTATAIPVAVDPAATAAGVAAGSSQAAPQVVTTPVVEPVPQPQHHQPPAPPQPQPPPASQAAPSSPPAAPATSTSTVVATINEAAAKTELMSRFRHQCLQQMRLGDFRKQKLAKLQEDLRVKGGAAATSLGSGSPYDNIFKTLMDEMTSLEINQSIFDVYVSNLHSCFVQVVDDVLLEQERARLEFGQTVGALQARLLEAGQVHEAVLRRLNRLETHFLASSAAWVISLLAVLLLACAFCVAGLRGRRGALPAPTPAQNKQPEGGPFDPALANGAAPAPAPAAVANGGHRHHHPIM
jgi:hypothetical protein